uniref:E3 ubiquitin-protein ligase RBBP6 n=1 Tax=Globodera rostochiensis TaxID=31243 RepID=A0A914H4Y2_GLORO
MYPRLFLYLNPSEEFISLMFSVHYKFKATLEYKTLTFDGLHIGVDELKKAICDKENIRTESFDLLLTNAHTKREYAVGELVPRNSSVVVQRIPRENALKLPKVQDTSTSGIISRNVSSSLFQQNSYIKPEEFAGMTEEQRLAHIKRVSTEKYNSSNYQRRTGGIMTGPPPATYVCNRCGQPGHWYKSCPLLNVRRTAGITMDELMETHRDDPLAMIHPSGKFVKPIMHHQARMQRKYEPFPGQPDESRSPGQSATTTAVPEQFRCRLCGGILRDAVLSACCGHSFCAECYQQQLLTHPTQLCPGADCVQQISADSLVPNKMLRDAVQKYLILGIGALEPATTMTASVGGTITAATMTAQAGANKPNVLTDTHSLLHKLLPGLAAAQAQRELDTTATPSTATTTALSSAPTVSNTTASAADEMAAATSMQTIAAGTQGSGTFSAHPQQQIGVPPSTSGGATSSAAPGGGNAVPLAALFDPNKPPPALTASMLASVAGAAPTTDPTSRMHAGSGAGMPSLYAAPHSQSGNAQPMFTGGAANSMVPTSTALSAEDSLSVWESFLKRKENEKAERNLQLMRNSGSNIYQLQQQQRAAANMLFEGGREQPTAYGRDRDRGSDRDHRDHHHYHHRNSGSSSRGGGGGGATTDKDEEGGGGRHSKPSKMTVEEMSSVWKLFEKHSNEKKEEDGAKERAEGDKKKEEEKEGREEKNDSAWREERRTKEKGKKEGKEEWSEKSEEKRKLDKGKEGKDGWREEQEKEKKSEKEERKREEGREEKGAKTTKREEKRKDGKNEWRGEKEEKEKSVESRKVEKDEGKDGWKEEKSKESSKQGKDEGKREEGREVKEEGGSTREEKRREGKTEWREEKEKYEERRKTEKGDGKREEVKEEKEERPKREDKKKEGRDERKGEKEKSEETRKRERTERNDQSGKEEKGEKARREETSRERKEERAREKGAKEKRKEGKDEWVEAVREVKEKSEEKRKTEKDGGKKEEGRDEKGVRSRRDEKRKEGRDDWRGERKKERRTTAEEERGDKDKRLFVSPPVAVNQLDITLAQEEAAGWRSGRLRHAPPQSPPNFEDTSRWRPIPEVQVRTESPANAGDELFINMADKRRAERKESVEAVVKEAAEFSSSSSRRRSESQSHDQKNGKGDAEEKEKKKRGKRERSHKRRHQSGGTATEATEDDERGGGGGKRRRKHKKEKKSKRKRKEKE